MYARNNYSGHSIMRIWENITVEHEEEKNEANVRETHLFRVSSSFLSPSKLCFLLICNFMRDWILCFFFSSSFHTNISSQVF